MGNSVVDVFKELGIDVASDDLGVVVGKKTATPKPMKKAITTGDKEKALQDGVIPEALKDVEFDFDIIKSNIMERGLREQYRVANFRTYEEVLSNILYSIKAGTIPNRSWLIGAPKRFGKIEFVNDALKFMTKQDMKCVPYISLTELSDKKYERDTEIEKNEAVKRVMKTAIFDEERVFITPENGREIRKPVKNITEIFGWQDYLKADIVFCFFTTVSNKEIESMTLKTLLDIRGSKGLPTIVFMDMSLEAYTSNEKLKDWVWNQILDNDSEDTNSVERYSTVKHISTYQMKSNRNIEVTEFDLKSDLNI